jgi:hypothetical protein
MLRTRATATIERLQADRTTWRLTLGFGIFFGLGAVTQLVTAALWGDWTVSTFVFFLVCMLIVDALTFTVILATAIGLLRMTRAIRSGSSEPPFPRNK